LKQELPKPITRFTKRYPRVWKAFTELGERCHDAGPLDERSRRLVKLALSIGAGLEGVHTPLSVTPERRASAMRRSTMLHCWQ